jgi:O-succinylbenzoate synthase
MDALTPGTAGRGRITGASAIPFSVPLATSHASPGRRREGRLLRLEHGAAVGWGEASPLPGFSTESPEAAGEALARLCGRLAGSEVDWADPLRLPLLDAEPLPRSVRFAAELALVNLSAAVTGMPAARLLDPRARDTCPVAALLAGPTDACEARAGEIAALGFRAAKLKVGSADPAGDAERVHAVAARLGAGTALRLDANRAWSLAQALRFARAVEGIAIEYLEEPLSDPSQLPRFAAGTGMSVALDESLVSLSPGALAPFDGLRALVLKPTLLGGLARVRRFAERADALGAEAVVSATFETGIGLYGLAALAASLPGRAVPGGLGQAVPAGLGTAAFLAGDTVTPRFPADAPVVRLPAPYTVHPSPDAA